MSDDLTDLIAATLRRVLPFVSGTNPHSGSWEHLDSCCISASMDEIVGAVVAALEEEWVIFRPSEVTRVSVIGDRVYEVWADECAASLQDDGHTLKVFHYGEGGEAQAAFAAAFIADIKAAAAERAGAGE